MLSPANDLAYLPRSGIVPVRSNLHPAPDSRTISGGLLLCTVPHLMDPPQLSCDTSIHLSISALRRLILYIHLQSTACRRSFTPDPKHLDLTKPLHGITVPFHNCDTDPPPCPLHAESSTTTPKSATQPHDSRPHVAAPPCPLM